MKNQLSYRALGGLLLTLLTLVGCQAQLPTLGLSGGALAPAVVSTQPADQVAPAAANNPLPLTTLYKQTVPGVVNISVKATVQAGEQSPPLPNDPRYFFPTLPGMPQQPNQQGQTPTIPQYQYGEGSGWVWDKEGHIVTNYHVIRNAEEVTVTFNDESSVPAEVIGVDPDSDLAVLQVTREGNSLTPLPRGDSNKAEVGEPVIAIGNPFGLEGTMTSGIISAKGRVLPNNPETVQPGFSIVDVLQTDAAVNPGNSGGPLLDETGKVIGVTFQIEGRSGVNSGVGFAIPVSLVEQVVPELIQSGHIAHAWLGIQGRTVNSEIAKALDLPVEQGAQVITVNANSPADKAGLLGSSKQATVDGQTVETGGDIIIEANGQPIHNMDQLVTLVSHQEPGDTLALTVQRAGKTQTIQVTLGERPTSDAATQKQMQKP